MSLRGFSGCLKFIVFVVNFLFWLIGLGVISVCVWLIIDHKKYLEDLGGQPTDYFAALYTVLFIGGVMTLVGFLGCCGAWKESVWMLGMFFFSLITILLVEIAVIVLIYFQEAPYQEVIKKSVETTVMKKYNNQSSATSQTFDLIQEGLHCCGANGPSDWSRSVFNGVVFTNTREIGIPKGSANSLVNGVDFALPNSCCKLPHSRECSSAITHVEMNRLPTDQIYIQGCSASLIDFFEQHVTYLIAVGGGLALIQLLGLLFSFCLCCTLKKINEYKV